MATLTTPLPIASALKAQSKRKAKPLPAPSSLIKRTAQLIDSHLTIICPITGLLVPNDLPAYPGVVLEHHHPMVHNALSILDLDEAYTSSLSPEQMAALFLASLSSLGKLELIDTSLLVRMRLQVALTKGQFIIAFRFINEALRATRKHYPPLALDKDVTEDTINDYFHKCIGIENFVVNTEILTVTKTAPSFLSSSNQGKRLDKACYEAWLEVAPYMPTTFKTKAAPFIKTLATALNEQLVERIVIAVLEKSGAGDLNNEEIAGESVVAAWEFQHAVKEARREANKLGLHRDYLDDDLGLDDSYSPAPSTKEPVEINALDNLAMPEPAPSAEPKPLGKFAALIAARKAAQ